MAFNQSSVSMPSCLLAKSAALPERIFRLVAAPADDHGINIADVAIGEIELTSFRASRSTRFVPLGLTGVRSRSGQEPARMVKTIFGDWQRCLRNQMRR